MGKYKHYLRRALRQIPQRKKFVLFCEGANTEPDYFACIKAHYGRKLAGIQCEPASGSGMKLAEKAVEFKKGKKRNSRGKSWNLIDEVWAVFDDDDNPDSIDAINHCQRNNVGVAFSNPCFELWLILHDSEYEKSDDKKSVQNHFAKFCPDYDPSCSKSADFSSFVPKIEHAEGRATKQRQLREEDGDKWKRPSTSVGDLTIAIRKAVDDQKR